MSGGIELEPDPRRLRIARNLRRIGAAALIIFLALGLAGLFDPSEGRVSATAGGSDGTKLTLDFPERARAGLESTLELEVSRLGGFQGPIEIAITRDWLAMFDVGSIDPEPDSATADPENLVWSFEPPTGERLAVTLNLTLRPAVRSGERAQVMATANGEWVLTGFDTSVVP